MSDATITVPQCRICTHNQRQAIEVEIAAGTPDRAISRRYGVSRNSPARHRDRGHMHMAEPERAADAPVPAEPPIEAAVAERDWRGQVGPNLIVLTRGQVVTGFHTIQLLREGRAPLRPAEPHEVPKPRPEYRAALYDTPAPAPEPPRLLPVPSAADAQRLVLADAEAVGNMRERATAEMAATARDGGGSAPALMRATEMRLAQRLAAAPDRAAQLIALFEATNAWIALRQLASRGVQITAQGDQLVVHPAGGITNEVDRRLVQEHYTAILAASRNFETIPKENAHA
jgi:hypothetical protein